MERLSPAIQCFSVGCFKFCHYLKLKKVTSVRKVRSPVGDNSRAVYYLQL